MSYGWRNALKLGLGSSLLLVVLPTACATGVEPEAEDGNASEGGSAAQAGSGSLGGTGVIPSAGKPSTTGGSTSNAFGGSSSAGMGAGGSASTGGKGGAGGSASTGGKGGAGGGTGGSGTGGGTGGGGPVGCACPTKKVWMDNTVLSWKTGDCLTVGAATYVYTGVIAQTYANGQCNPTKQEPWCADTSNDYKFMLCP